MSLPVQGSSLTGPAVFTGILLSAGYGAKMERWSRQLTLLFLSRIFLQNIIRKQRVLWQMRLKFQLSEHKLLDSGHIWWYLMQENSGEFSQIALYRVYKLHQTKHWPQAAVFQAVPRCQVQRWRHGGQERATVELYVLEITSHALHHKEGCLLLFFLVSLMQSKHRLTEAGKWESDNASEPKWRWRLNKQDK